MPSCSTIGCKNEGIHLFPREPKIREQWLKALGRKDFQPSTWSRLCTAHFKPDDYLKENQYTGLAHTRKILKKGVVPSIFDWCKPEETKEKKRKRKQGVRKNNKSLVFENKNEDVECSSDTIVKSPNVTSTKTNTFCEIEIADEYITIKQETRKGPTTNDHGTQKDYQFFSLERFRKNNEAMLFYTGFESFDKFMFVFHTLCPYAYSLKYRCSQYLHISSEEQFFLTLIKLRRNKDDYELGLFFDISPFSVSNIFITWINFIHSMWEKLDVCTEEDNFRMSEELKKHNPTRVVVNGTEVVWTSYDNRKKIKLEVDDFPVSSKTLCSQASTESTSEKQTRKVPSKQAHTKRVIKQILTYKFLQDPINAQQFAVLMPKIYYVCQTLFRFKEKIKQ